jgi:hypothetical protein
MKKFVISLVLLLIVAVTVFFFGWIQFRIGPDEYLVIFTKTNGWEQKALVPGEFHWRWQALLPTNMKIYRISSKVRTIDLSIDAQLPSGDLYASIIDRPGVFNYSLKAQLDYRIMPEHLPSLIETGILNVEDPDQYFSVAEEELSLRISRTADNLANQIQESGGVEILRIIEKQIIDTIDQIEGIEVQNFLIKNLVVPDFRLYEAARNSYLDILNARTAGQAIATRENALQENRLRDKISYLSEYGKVLENYPTLLDYFSMQSTTGTDPLNIENLLSDLTGRLNTDE